MLHIVQPRNWKNSPHTLDPFGRARKVRSRRRIQGKLAPLFCTHLLTKGVPFCKTALTTLREAAKANMDLQVRLFFQHENLKIFLRSVFCTKSALTCVLCWVKISHLHLPSWPFREHSMHTVRPGWSHTTVLFSARNREEASRFQSPISGRVRPTNERSQGCDQTSSKNEMNIHFNIAISGSVDQHVRSDVGLDPNLYTCTQMLFS